VAFAAESRLEPQFPNLRVQADLDGDQLPDTALVRQHGSQYALSVKLSSKRTWIHVHAYSTNEAVIGIASMDVDGDQDRDIVLLGLNPFRPSGLWLNEGARGFRTERPWLAAGFQRNSGAHLARLASFNTDEGPGSLDEPGPDALVPHYLLPTVIKAGAGLSRESREVPFSGPSSNLPLRGPPSL